MICVSLSNYQVLDVEPSEDQVSGDFLTFHFKCQVLDVEIP
jgi:hypothetical protein